MSLNTHTDCFEVECDWCGCTQEHERDITARYGEDNGFMDMIESLKEDGWKIFKTSDTEEWNHFCPECKEKDRS